MKSLRGGGPNVTTGEAARSCASNVRERMFRSQRRSCCYWSKGFSWNVSRFQRVQEITACGGICVTPVTSPPHRDKEWPAGAQVRAGVNPSMGKTLRQDLADYAAGDVRQAEVATLKAVGQPCVVDAEQVQNRGVQVVDMHRVFDGFIA